MIDDLVDIVLRQAPIGRERIAEHLGPCFNVLLGINFEVQHGLGIF